MNAIIVDIEATCCDRGTIPPHQMEIIEIGAVAILRDTGARAAEFSTLVRPVVHPQLTPFCTTLTGIQQAEVDAAPGFAAAVALLRAWLVGFSPYEFCSWGDFDRRQFQLDCQRHRLGFPFAGPHRNLKLEFSRAMGCTKKFGVTGALERAGLRFEGTPHRALTDAQNIARLFPLIEGRSPTG